MNGETTRNGMTILSRSHFRASFKGMGFDGMWQGPHNPRGARPCIGKQCKRGQALPPLARLGWGRWSSQWVAKGEVGKSRSLLKRYKAQLHSLSLPEKEAAVGVMLGDASLQTQDGGRTHRLKLLQGEKNRLYLCHLSELFSDWILSPPAPQHRVSALGREARAWRTQTMSHRAFNELAEIFLPDGGKKSIPPNLVGEHLTPRGLAYWLMDDGGRSNCNRDRPELRGMTINTQGFTEEEVTWLSNGLRLHFRLDCWVGRDKGRWVITILGRSFPHLMRMVGPYLHPSMLYKFPLAALAELEKLGPANHAGEGQGATE